MSDWIEWKWTPEKPYPETLETLVDVKFRNVESEGSDFVKNWDFSSEGDDFDIIAYKVVK